MRNRLTSIPLAIFFSLAVHGFLALLVFFFFQKSNQISNQMHISEIIFISSSPVNVNKENINNLAGVLLARALPTRALPTRALPTRAQPKNKNTEVQKNIEDNAESEHKTSGIGSAVNATNSTNDIALKTYLKSLQNFIEENKISPQNLKALQLRGKVEVTITIDHDGNFSLIHISNSSTVKAIDEAALRFIEKLQKFSPLPKEIGKNSIDVRVPIEYN